MANKTAAVEKACAAENTVRSGDAEVELILTALRLLKKQASNPVVRECLEAARSDIAHLAVAGGEMKEDDEEDLEAEDDEDDDLDDEEDDLDDLEDEDDDLDDLDDEDEDEEEEDEDEK